MLYIFNMCREGGVSTTLEMVDLPHHRAAFEKARDLLAQHASSDHIEVWHQDQAIVALYRDQPIIRPMVPPQKQSAPAP